MSQPEPLTEQQLDEYAACVADYRRHVPTGWACCSAHPVADAGAALLAEIRRLRVKTRTLGELAARRESELIGRRAELAAVEMLAPQQCPAGRHADWLVDSEYAHACPWCRVAELERPAADPDSLPAWLYQRFMAGGVGWENLDDDGRAYWEHQARAVRRAVARGGFRTASEATTAPLAASQPPEVPMEPETATETPEGRVGDSGKAGR